MNRKISADEIRQTIQKAAANPKGAQLQAVALFDVYEGKGIREGYKSMALGLIWQHPLRTLKDEEINRRMDIVVQALIKHLNAELRAS